MRKRAWTVLASGAVLACALTAVPAGAQTNKVAAEALFDEAIKLMKDGKYDQACPKLADSQRLDPAANTLLNLAACYEKQGKTASAWETYKEAEAAERDAHKEQYMQLAHDRAAALEPNLLKLTITASTKPPDGTVIKLDGTPVPMSEWGTAVPVDPGKHTVDVTAPNKIEWTKEVTIGEGGVPSPATLDVPALQDQPAATQPTTTTTAQPATTTATTMAPAEAEQTGMPGQRKVALVVGAVGVVGLVAGGVFAGLAASKNSDSKNNCRTSDPNACNSTGVSQRNDAQTFGNVASIALGVGGVAIVTGVVLWLTAPSAPRRTAYVDVVPTLGGAMIRGAF